MWRSIIVATALASFLLLPSGHDKAIAQSAGLVVVAVNLDITPGQIDAYLAAVKENGAATVKEPGPRVQYLGRGERPEPCVSVRGL